VLNKLSNYIVRIATGRITLFATFASIAFLIPYFTIPYKALLAKGILIDQVFNFSSGDVHHILSSYSAAERIQYMHAEIIDLFVPLVTIAVAIIVSYAFKKSGWRTEWNLIPLFAGLFNDAKTLLMFPIISGYPHESGWLIAMANGINMIKIILLTMSIGLLLMAVGTLLTSKRQNTLKI
jgi:hypothetical protein